MRRPPAFFFIAYKQATGDRGISQLARDKTNGHDELIIIIYAAIPCFVPSRYLPIISTRYRVHAATSRGEVYYRYLYAYGTMVHIMCLCARAIDLIILYRVYNCSVPRSLQREGLCELCYRCNGYEYLNSTGLCKGKYFILINLNKIYSKTRNNKKINKYIRISEKTIN